MKTNKIHNLKCWWIGHDPVNAQAARAAKELGFKSIQTFILPEESGVSLKASGWLNLGRTKTGSWHTRLGRRNDQPEQPKIKWVKYFGQGANKKTCVTTMMQAEVLLQTAANKKTK